jgi:hypothetical protein
MPRFVNTFFEELLNRLFDLAEMVERIFSSAGLEYRVWEVWRPICTSRNWSRTPAV